jgi:hypothetical protein
MNDMRKLMESLDKFSGEPKQRPGDQVQGTDQARGGKKDHPFKNRLVGETAKLAESLMVEYQFFIEQPVGVPADNTASPVANINPAGAGTANVSATSANVSTGAKQSPTVNTTQPQGAVPPTNPAQAAAAEKASLKQGMSNLRSINPQQNVDRAVQALQADPKKVTGADGQNLANLTNNVLEPLLKDPGTAAMVRNAVQKQKAKVQ